jgi:hypothetical protein
MTEAEWLGCVDPKPMLEFLQGKVSDRKLRLFAVACCRRIWSLLADKRSRMAVEVGEKVADGMATDEEEFAAYEAACNAKDDAWCGAYENVDFPAVAASYVVCSDPSPALVAGLTASAGDDPRGRAPGETAFQCRLLRDINSNPFRPITIDPAWLAWNDGTVQKIAQAIYDERAFDRMPILADALEEAGCPNQDILTHCRSGGEHVRGCWVVDLLLGKS